MSTVTNRHAYLRNATSAALGVHESARPVPAIVQPGEVVKVDEWAASDLKASGFEKATAAEWSDPNVEAITVQLDEHLEQHDELTAVPDGEHPDTEADGAEGDHTEGDAS